MKRHQEMITTIIVLGLACAVHPGESRELPEDMREFAAQQHQEILAQGREARRAIGYKLRADFESRRIAFVESQGRSIIEQGRAALASMEKDLLKRGLVDLKVDPPERLAARGGRREAVENIRWALAITAGSLSAKHDRLVRLDHLQAWTQPGWSRTSLRTAGHADSGS